MISGVIKRFAKTASVYSHLVVSVFLAAVLFAACVIVFNHSFGWFSNNKKVDAEGMVIAAKDPETVSIEEYRVYNFDFDLNSAVEVSNNIQGDDLCNALFAMNAYDTILTEYNENSHIVIRVIVDHVREDKDGIRFVLSSGSALLSEEDGTIAPKLSNICAIRWMYGNANAGAAQIYGAFASSTQTPRSFAQVTGTGSQKEISKTDELTFDIDDFEGNVYTENGVRKLCVYIEIAYNERLIDEYVDQNNITSTALEDFWDLEIDFDSDIEPIVFSYYTEEAGGEEQ